MEWPGWVCYSWVSPGGTASWSGWTWRAFAIGSPAAAPRSVQPNLRSRSTYGPTGPRQASFDQRGKTRQAAHLRVPRAYDRSATSVLAPGRLPPGRSSSPSRASPEGRCRRRCHGPPYPDSRATTAAGCVRLQNVHDRVFVERDVRILTWIEGRVRLESRWNGGGHGEPVKSVAHDPRHIIGVAHPPASTVLVNVHGDHRQWWPISRR